MKILIISMPDGSNWGIPLALIAHHKAVDYVYFEFTDKSLTNFLFEDVIPSFKEDPELAIKWAEEIKWTDAKNMAKPIDKESKLNDKQWEKGWLQGNKKVRDIKNYNTPFKKPFRINNQKNHRGIDFSSKQQ